MEGTKEMVDALQQAKAQAWPMALKIFADSVPGIVRMFEQFDPPMKVLFLVGVGTIVVNLVRQLPRLILRAFFESF